MQPKMINLCPATFKIASQMPNFSEWVREQLKECAFQKNEEKVIVWRYKCMCCKQAIDLTVRGRTLCLNPGCAQWGGQGTVMKFMGAVE